MKICEIIETREQISEIDIGSAPYWFDPRRLWGQGKISRQVYNQITNVSKSLFDQWLRYAVALDRNINAQAKTDIRLKDNFFIFDIKKKHFKYFLKSHLRLGDSDRIYGKIDSVFGKIGEGYNKKNIKNLIDIALTDYYLSSMPADQTSKTASSAPASMVSKMAKSSAAPSQSSAKIDPMMAKLSGR